MLGYYCLASSHFLLKDYTSALKYLDVIKVIVDCSLTTLDANFNVDNVYSLYCILLSVYILCCAIWSYDHKIK